MHINPLAIRMHQGETIKPCDVIGRHLRCVTPIRGKRGVAAAIEPPPHSRRISQRLDHHRIMVALERKERPSRQRTRFEDIDNRLAVGSLVDVIAERDNRAGPAGRMRDDAGKTVAEQIAPAVNVRNDVGETQGREPKAILPGLKMPCGSSVCFRARMAPTVAKNIGSVKRCPSDAAARLACGRGLFAATNPFACTHKAECPLLDVKPTSKAGTGHVC